MSREPSRLRSIAITLAKLSVSVLLVVLLARRVSFAGAAQHLAELRWWPAVGAVLLLGLSFLLSAWRWHVASLHLLPFGQCLRFTWIAHFYGLILPGALTADVAKGVAMSRDGQSDASVLATSIVMDRVAGLGSLVVFGVLSCLAQPGILPFSDAALTLLSAVLALGLILLPWLSRKVLALSFFDGPRFTSLRQLMTGFDRRIWLRVLGLSVLIHAVNITFYWTGFVAVAGRASWWRMGLYTCLLNLAMMLPVSLAGVGLRDQLSASFLNQADNGAAGVALAWLVLAIFVLHGFVGLFLQWRLWRTPPRK